MKKLSVGLPFRGQGKVQTKSWLLLLALGLLACMTMCLILDFINIAQNKLQERKALRAKLEVERERLLSPYELRRKAEEIGMKEPKPGQVRRMEAH